MDNTGQTHLGIPEESIHLASSAPVIDTRLSKVNGDIGELLIAGYPVEEIANKLDYEEGVYLLWYGHLPASGDLGLFRQKLKERRELPIHVMDILKIAADQQMSVIDALRTAASSLKSNCSDELSYEALEQDAILLISSFPLIVASYWRLLHGMEIVHPHAELDHAANYLYMLLGRMPAPEETRTLQTYLNAVIEHSVNASTLTARVIMSTRSDVVSSVVGALGALKGPLHGGAPGPALTMILDMVREKSNAEHYLRTKLDSGERLMGFGHRVYRTVDPRATILLSACERLCKARGNNYLFETAQYVERLALELLEEYKPHRSIKTNVEYYTALVLHELGIHQDLFTPTFAISRVAGWTAHCFEQWKYGRLIRAKGSYCGSDKKTWIPISDRE